MNKKLLWSTMGLLPLVATPVVLISSCSESASPATKVAKSLNESDKIKFKANKGTYSMTQLDTFSHGPKAFIDEIEIDVENKEQFNFEVIEFDITKNDEEQKTYAKIKIKVTDLNNEADSVDSDEINLAINFKQPSEAVKANVEAANKAFDNKSFKLKDTITFDAAHLKALQGYASLSAQEKSKIDPLTVLQSLFDGVVEGDARQTNLSIYQFEILKAEASSTKKANFTIKLQLSYEDVAGEKTNALTKEVSFNVEYDQVAKAQTIINVLETIAKIKWIKLNQSSYPDKTITNETILDNTNFKNIKKQFLPDNFSYSVEQNNFQETTKNNQVSLTVKITAQKDSDSATMPNGLSFTYTKITPDPNY